MHDSIDRLIFIKHYKDEFKDVPRQLVFYHRALLKDSTRFSMNKLSYAWMVFMRELFKPIKEKLNARYN